MQSESGNDNLLAGSVEGSSVTLDVVALALYCLSSSLFSKLSSS